MEEIEKTTNFWTEFISSTLHKFYDFLPQLIYAAIFLIIGVFWKNRSK